MGSRAEKHAVIVADDFGKSASINLAIAEAHDRGILTAASIMAGGAAFTEAVRIARNRSRLSIGLHVTLCDGKSVLPYSEIPGLVDLDGCFERNPLQAWLKYGRPGLQKQLDAEIGAQFDRLEKAGIQPDHVDGHHHVHMHPWIFPMVCRHASRRGIQWVRIPHKPLSCVFSSGRAMRGALPLLEWSLCGVLRLINRAKAGALGLYSIPRVYGFSGAGQIDDKRLFDLFLQQDELMEIFFHPDIATKAGRSELDALISGAVRTRLDEIGVSMVGYQDLSDENVLLNTGMARTI